MIVRILGKDQFRIDDTAAAELNQLDSGLETAVERGDETAFSAALNRLLAYVRAHGSPLPADALEPSDLILPREDSSMDEVRKMLTDEESNKQVAELKKIADELDVPLSQFSLAWCAKNPNVSTVITGASTADQVRENMKALDVIPLLTDEIMERVDLVWLMGNAE